MDTVKVDLLRSLLGFLAKPWSIVVLTMLYLAFILLIFPAAAINTNAPPIDLAFHYSVDQVYGWIELYGDEGRKRYILGELTVDVLYPIVYTFLFCGLIGFFTNVAEKGRYSQLAALPFAIWLFDMLENTGIVTMLYQYPVRLNEVAYISAWFTSIKWTLAIVVIVATVLLGIRFVYQKVSNQR